MAFDTTTEARDLQRDIWRTLGPDVRLELAIELSAVTRRITLDGIAERNPGLDRSALIRTYIELVHGIDAS